MLTKEEKELQDKYDVELNELHQLTEIENPTGSQIRRYVELVEYLHDNNVPIDFGIEM